jgi:putative endonuclease
VTWIVYVVRCADSSLYCGITNDLPARLAAHEAGAGAKYTRGRGPLELVATQATRSKGLALRIEHAVKQLPRAQKLALDRKRLGALAAAARRRLKGSGTTARSSRKRGSGT